jgi:hypothetical protein
MRDAEFKAIFEELTSKQRRVVQAFLSGKSDEAIAPPDVERLTALIGGHPYLVQLALYYLHKGEMTLDTLLQTAPTQAGIYSHHLRRYWQTLQTHPELLTALRTVIDADSTGVTIDPIVTYKLESMGLIQVVGDRARVSCALYHHYFQPLLKIVD